MIYLKEIITLIKVEGKRVKKSCVTSDFSCGACLARLKAGNFKSHDELYAEDNCEVSFQ